MLEIDITEQYNCFFWSLKQKKTQIKTTKSVQGGSYFYQSLFEHYDRFEKIVAVLSNAYSV